MHGWNEVFTICGRFALAVVLSGAVGLERQRKGRGAGLRTHILVCLGATLAVSVADLFSKDWTAAGGNVWMDKGRIAAGVLTGIGFLGAGTIIQVGGEHRGLTTAAMIWFVAALGTGIGAGYYALAVCATGFALLVVLGLERVDALLPSEEWYVLTLRLPEGHEKLHKVEGFLRENGCKVAASRFRFKVGGSHVDMTFDIAVHSDFEVERLMQVLQDRFSKADEIVLER